MTLWRKDPPAERQWAWQYVFPAEHPGRGPRRQVTRCHHLHETVIQRAVEQTVGEVGISRMVSCHTFRHSFATHLLAEGYDIRTIQELLGHRKVKTTMIYTHVLSRGGHAVVSPADALLCPGIAGSAEFRQLDLHPTLLPPAPDNPVPREEDAEGVGDDEEEE